MNQIDVDEPKNFFIHFFFNEKENMGCFVGAFTSEGLMLPEVSAIKSKSSYISSSQPILVCEDGKNRFLYINKLKFNGEIAEMIQETWKNHFLLCNLIPDHDIIGTYLLLPSFHQKAVEKAYQEKIRDMKLDDPFLKTTADFRLQMIKATPWSSKVS